MEFLSAANGAWGKASFTYDGVGNRSSDVNTIGGVTNTRLAAYGTASNRITGMTENGAALRSYTYDNGGNILTDTRPGEVFAFTYNARNRSASVTRNSVAYATYGYNAFERLITHVTERFEVAVAIPISCYQSAMTDEFLQNPNAKAIPDLPSADEGFVLVSVIWVAGLLAVVATAFAITIRSHTLASSGAVYNMKAESVADGMALATALRLATPTTVEQPASPNGATAYCNWSDEIAVAISVQDQGGLVDLNTASPELLKALLRGIGADEAKSAEIAAALQDFRDPDSQSASGGVEPAIYPGKAYGPKNAPFTIPEEVDQIPELDHATFHKFMPFVTVQSQQPGIDPAHAPLQLLDLLGAGESILRLASPSPARTFSIDVTAELKNGSRYRRHALISLLRQPERPFAVLAWQRGGDTGDSAALPRSGPACFN